MKKFIKIACVFSIFVGFLLAILYEIFVFRFIPDSLGRTYASFAAKEGCSCLFVVNAPEEYCKNYVKQFFSPDGWSKGQDSLIVEFETFFSQFQAKAVFRISRGCNLQSISH